MTGLPAASSGIGPPDLVHRDDPALVHGLADEEAGHRGVKDLT